jgi:hypothetical protein
MMAKKIGKIGVMVLVGALLVGAIAVWALPLNAEAAWGRGQVSTPRSASIQGTVPAGSVIDAPSADLSEWEEAALLLALQDEYKAWSLYEQVIEEFGAVWPFTSIQRAEENHIAALVTLLDRYGVDVPVNEYAASMESGIGTLAEACELGVDAEVNNAALYDQLLGMVDNADIIQVFEALQAASQTKHLPALELCAP